MRYSPSRLRAAREARQLSREDVARRIGRTAGTIYKYESGLIVPTVYVLGDLAEVYAVDVGELYDPADPDDAVTAFAAEIRAIAAKYPALDDEQKREIKALLFDGAA